MSQAWPRQKARALIICAVPLVVFAACGAPVAHPPGDPVGIVLSPVRVAQAPAASTVPAALPPLVASPTLRPAAAATFAAPTVAAPTATFATAAAPTPLPQPTSAPAPTAAPPFTASPQPTPLTADQREQVFTQVWQMVKDDYLYTNFNGTDWVALREEYEPRIAAARSNEEFYTELIEMVARLNDHHSRFGPPAAVVSEDAIVSGREATVGIGVQTVPLADGAFVQAVFPDSPAQRAGIRLRDRIVAVDGRAYQQDDGDLEGPVGSSVRLSIVSPGEKPHDVVLPRQEVQAHITPYYTRFPGDIGYVAVSTLWVSDTDDQVSGALTELIADGALNGVILDLRGNPGGLSHVMKGVLSHFVRGQVGTFFDRRGHTRALVISAPPGPDLRGMPLAVLIDHGTTSYAELIAAVLQREAQAQVIGVASAGNTETIYPHTLSDGSRLWLAQEGFKLQSGANLEGNGVQPNVVVDVDWRRYSEDDDPQLLEALRLLGAGPK